MRTGDVGRIDEQGFITLTDRAKDVIKSGGEWISSVELENCLIAHPDVLEAAVVGVPDERWQERPLAVVVVREGATVSAGDLRAFLADKVVRWWLPERWAFVDEIPAPAWASTTRRPSVLATPKVPTRSPRCTLDPREQTQNRPFSCRNGGFASARG